MSLLPSCRDVQTDLTNYLEGGLSPMRRLGVWIHLRMCRVCAAFLRGLRALPGVAKRSLAPPAAVPPDAAATLAQVQAALRKRQGP